MSNCESWISCAAWITPIPTTMIALVAFTVAWRQLRLNRSNESSRLFLNWMDECLKNPKFAYINYDENCQFTAYFRDGVDVCVEDVRSYHWFVSKLLNACDYILADSKASHDWVDSIRSNLDCHAKYLWHLWDTESVQKYYGYSLINLLEEVLAERELIVRQKKWYEK
jgi:hypothetical protein